MKKVIVWVGVFFWLGAFPSFSQGIMNADVLPSDSAEYYMNVSADMLEVFQTSGRMALSGKVSLEKNTSQFLADRMEVFFQEKDDTTEKAYNFSVMKQIKAYDNVNYHSDAMDISADKFVYNLMKETITFLGNVILIKQENQFFGDVLVLDLGTQTTTIKNKAKDSKVKAKIKY